MIQCSVCYTFKFVTLEDVFVQILENMRDLKLYFNIKSRILLLVTTYPGPSYGENYARLAFIIHNRIGSNAVEVHTAVENSQK